MNLADNGIAHHNVTVLRTSAHEKPFTEERINLWFCIVGSLNVKFWDSGIGFKLDS